MKDLILYIPFSCFNFRWHDIKKEEICEPMEKIGDRKEL